MLKFKVMTTLMPKEKIQIVTIAENQLLLLQFAKFHNNGFQNITGSVEKGETFREAANRELFEETGLSGHLIETPLQFEFLDRWGFKVLEKVFFCKFDKIPSITLSDEHLNYKWIPINKVTLNDFVFPTNFEAFKKSLELNK